MFGFRVFCGLLLILVASGSASTFGQTRSDTRKMHVCGARSAKEKPFLEAVKTGNARLIRQFLQKGADANLRNDCNTPVIIYAAITARPDILKILVESGADVNAMDEKFYRQPPLLWVIRKADDENERKRIYESVRILIDSGADVNLTGKSEESALMAAVLAEDERLVEFLIAARADVNYKDYEERTAYSYAAQSGSKKLKKILTDAGADTTVGVAEYQKKYGENAFFQASADGRTDVVEAMLEAGTSVNAVNSGKMTALMRATEDSTVDLLIDAGADVNLKDNAGFTALIWAAAFRRKSHVAKLVAAGADVDARNSDGKTALDFVNDPEIRTILVEAGAKIK